MDCMKMEVIFLVLLATILNLVQGLRKISLAEEMELEMQLKLINKPAIKSFETDYGDIFDCVEIGKQLAFDHPLLKNHPIQMKPSNTISKLGRPSSRWNASQLSLRNNITCPEGTVMIKRVQKQDLLMAKFSTSFGRKFESKGSYQPDELLAGHQVATLVLPAKNIGIRAVLNVWHPDVKDDQFSSSNVFVASPDGSVANGIAAGWGVNPILYPNQPQSTQLFVYWTNDSGKSTGCFNMLCPGFVQVSQKTPVGTKLEPVSYYGSEELQYDFLLDIVQDDTTGNWWVEWFGELVGYYPKELFTTLADGASSGGWGGDIFSPIIEKYPPMGSAHFPEEGFGKACYIRDMKLLDPSPGHIIIRPDNSTLLENVSMPRCYRALYVGDYGGDDGPTMYFGGPADCIWEED